MGLFGQSKSVDRRWWEKTGRDLGHAVMENYATLRDQRHNSPGRYHAYMSIYMNRNITSDLGTAYMEELVQATKTRYDRARFNVSKLMVDTVYNRIAKMRPVARFLPTAGSPDLQKRAKDLERWSAAVGKIANLNKVAPLVFQDALIFGTGILKPYRVGKSIKVERVFPGEVFVDEVEAAYDNVRQLFHRKYVAREVVLYSFVDLPFENGKISQAEAAERRKAILKAPRCNAKDDILSAHSVVTDPIEVVEAWHLPSGETAKDGLHVICIQGKCLYEDKWERESFPLCFVRWSPEPRGFYGIGLVEELYGIHVDINTTLQRIEDAMKINASPYIFREQNSSVKTQHITDIPGTIINYRGTKPEIHTVNTVPPEYLTYLNDQVSRAYRIARVNVMSSGNKIPAGLETGAAVREWYDTDREDFATVMQEYEGLFAQVTREFVYLGQEIYEDYPNYTVVAPKDRNTVSKIAWKDVDMDEDAYFLEVQPASSLPNTPAGRMAFAFEMLDRQLIDPTRAMQIIDVPDIDREMDLATSEPSVIDGMIQKILTDGDPQVLEPTVDFRLVLTKASAEYNRAVINGVPEDRLRLLRDFMNQAKRQIQKQMAIQDRQMQQAAGPPAIDQQGQNPLAGANNV